MSSPFGQPMADLMKGAERHLFNGRRGLAPSEVSIDPDPIAIVGHGATLGSIASGLEYERGRNILNKLDIPIASKPFGCSKDRAPLPSIVARIPTIDKLPLDYHCLGSPSITASMLGACFVLVLVLSRKVIAKAKQNKSTATSHLSSYAILNLVTAFSLC